MLVIFTSLFELDRINSARTIDHYSYLNKYHLHLEFFSTALLFNLISRLYIIMIALINDVEGNPRPKGKAKQLLQICHWNLKNISAHNF